MTKSLTTPWITSDIAFRSFDMSKKKIVLIVSASLIGALALAVAIPFSVLGIRSANLKGDYSYLRGDPNYSAKASVEGMELVKQRVSCGYASIEMISAFYGCKVSEAELDARNGAVSTSSSKGFLNEIGRCIPSQSFQFHSYLKSDALLKEIHDSLSRSNPVAVEWAAQYENEWTLHFSVVTSLDIAQDAVTVYNPYGFVEEIGIDEFLDRTSFEAYANMPLFLSFGFAFGAFDKNAIFYAR